MNEIVNKCLLTGDKFMPEMQLKQPRFTYSAFGLFTKNKKILKFMQTGDTNYIYRNDLDKTWYKDLKISGLDIKDIRIRYEHLTKGTEPDKVLKDNAFKIASNPKYDGYENELASMVYKFFDKNLKPMVLNLCQLNNLQMNFINLLSENLKNAKSIHLLKTIFGELILQLISKYNKG